MLQNLKAWDRFWSKVEKGPACWQWIAGKNPAGYGRYLNSLAHKVSYVSCVGNIASGMQVHHKCNNPSCVNPSHLELHTPKTHPNPGKNKTHCKRGHEFTPENTQSYKFGERTCKICFNRWRKYDYKARKFLEGGI